MDALAQALGDLLQQELCLLQELSGFLARDRELLLRFSLDEITENNKRKETLILRQRILEEARQELAQRISTALEPEDGPLTLLDIITRLGPEAGDRLSDLRSQLLGCLGEVKALSSHNQGWLRQSLKCVDAQLGFLHSLGAPHSTYQASGRLSGKTAGVTLSEAV